MKYYLAALKKYTQFNGRSQRAEFWVFSLTNIFLLFVLFIIIITTGVIFGVANNLDSKTIQAICVSVLFILSSPLIFPTITVTVRRLHDIGRSGWWWFIRFVPIVGEIWILILMLLDSNLGENKYGPNPKEIAPTQTESSVSSSTPISPTATV